MPARAKAGADHRIDRAADVARHVLRQLGHAQAIAAFHLARVGAQLAGQHLQQRGLAGAVAADEAQPVAFFHHQVGPLQHGLAGVLDGH